jgi:hypothetical protein
MDEKEQKKYFSEGCHAFLSNKRVRECEHERRSEKWVLWIRGFEAAKEFCEVGFE